MTAPSAVPPPQSTTPEPLLDITLPAVLASVPAAREAIRLRLRDKNQHAERVETVLLLATELLTNAVSACNENEPVRLHMADGKGPVRVEVTDRCTNPPVMGVADTEATSGRGLMLVEGLATEWGHLPVSGGKVVWFVVD